MVLEVALALPVEGMSSKGSSRRQLLKVYTAAGLLSVMGLRVMARTHSCPLLEVPISHPRPELEILHRREAPQEPRATRRGQTPIGA
jgi:hypothetical protein